ncbi:pyrroloquinoline quinone biosynthesis protein B [Flavobacteriaceae bacterium MAR_2010_188]|nr:pyrroloquinoline quinone biosynthesis protein B [Flavobacteriaceae bacterium MAR_2010_188]
MRVRRFQLLCLISFSILMGCVSTSKTILDNSSQQYITVLGIAQDAGYPHINNPAEFRNLKDNKISRELVVSLGLVDQAEKKKWLFEATPDMPEQLYNLENKSFKSKNVIDGIFLTHAHIGHYTGLMYFGREAMGAKEIPVYAMPKMKTFLEENEPWKQLSTLNNIQIQTIYPNSSLNISPNLMVTPILVPHRDEFSETVAYKIQGPKKLLLFIPDINKWNLWEKNIQDELKNVDYALIDATFFEDGEIPRPMSEVPHPFIMETIELFAEESVQTRSKIYFIHLNHSNPALNIKSDKRKYVEGLGFKFAFEGQIFPLD